MQKRTNIAVVIGAMALAWSGLVASAPRTLDEALAAPSRQTGASGIPPLVYDSDRQQGLAFGAQTGLARCAFDELESIKNVSDAWDDTFQFSSLVMNGNVLPAVITEMRDVITQPDDTTFSVTGRVYRIDQQPRFIHTAPTWRNYFQLLMEFQEPEVPEGRPIESNRRAVWDQSVREGYEKGCAQAKQIAKQQFATMRRDWDGMQLYHELLKKKLVTTPFVVSDKNELIRDEKGNLHVDEVTLKIATNPDFIDKADGWAGHIEVQRGGRAIAQRLRNAAAGIKPQPAQQPKISGGLYGG